MENWVLAFATMTLRFLCFRIIFSEKRLDKYLSAVRAKVNCSPFKMSNKGVGFVALPYLILNVLSIIKYIAFDINPS